MDLGLLEARIDEPPGDLAGLVDFARGTMRRSAHRACVKLLSVTLRHQPRSRDLCAVEDAVLALFASMADTNSYLFKQEIAALVTYVSARSGMSNAEARHGMARIHERLLTLHRADQFQLGRILDVLHKSARRFPSPRFRGDALITEQDFRLQRLSIELTTRCNYACRKCSRAEVMKAETVDLDYGLLLRLLDEALEAGVQDLGLMGGEPTLYPHLLALLDWLLDKQQIAKQAFVAILFTNGSQLYRDRMCRDLIRRCNFLDVWITLDSLDPDEYPVLHGCPQSDYDRVMRQVGMAVDDGLASVGRLAITYPLSRCNLVHAEELWRLCRGAGILPRFTFVSRVGRAKQLPPTETLTPDEKLQVREAICAIDDELGYDTVWSDNGIGIRPFRAYNYLGIDAAGKTWDFFANRPGVDLRHRHLLDVWQSNLDNLNDVGFLRRQLESPFFATRAFAQRQLESLGASSPGPADHEASD